MRLYLIHHPIRHPVKDKIIIIIINKCPDSIPHIKKFREPNESLDLKNEQSCEYSTIMNISLNSEDLIHRGTVSASTLFQHDRY
jgi:hypothetical protein